MSDGRDTPLDNFLAYLSSEGAEINHEQCMELLTTDAEKTPIGLQALIAVGAVVTSLFILLFFGFALYDLFDSPSGLMVTGLALILGSIAGGRAAYKNQGTFVISIAHCFLLVGKILFVIGFSELFLDNSFLGVYGIPIATAFVSAISYFTLNSTLDRFASTLATLTAMTIAIMTNKNSDASASLFILFFAFQAAIATVLYYWLRMPTSLSAMRFAIMTSMLGMALFSALGWDNLVFDAPKFYNDPRIMQAITAAFTIAIIWWLSGGRKSPQIIAGIVLLIALAAMTNAAIILCIGLLILGYGTHDRLVSFLGAAGLPVAIWYFYDNIELTLLVKSAMLIGSGFLLLGARFAMRLFKWDEKA